MEIKVGNESIAFAPVTYAHARAIAEKHADPWDIIEDVQRANSGDINYVQRFPFNMTNTVKIIHTMLHAQGHTKVPERLVGEAVMRMGLNQASKIAVALIAEIAVPPEDVEMLDFSEGDEGNAPAPADGADS